MDKIYDDMHTLCDFFRDRVQNAQTIRDAEKYYKLYGKAKAVLMYLLPRVLALEEVPRRGVPVWVEFHGVGHDDGWVTCRHSDDTFFLYSQKSGRFAAWVAPGDTYERTWRCWTGKPLDAQKESAPWIP